jgi:hypothetical protein
MWRELIAVLGEHVAFQAPASAEEIKALESKLNASLPAELFSLLGETNGAEVGYAPLVWSVNDIAASNEAMRTQVRVGGELASFMPVDHLLFFGEAGNGVLFAFPITPEGVRDNVFLWDHEDDSRTCQARSLAAWLQGD